MGQRAIESVETLNLSLTGAFFCPPPASSAARLGHRRCDQTTLGAGAPPAGSSGGCARLLGRKSGGLRGRAPQPFYEQPCLPHMDRGDGQNTCSAIRSASSAATNSTATRKRDAAECRRRQGFNIIIDSTIRKPSTNLEGMT